MKKKANAGMKLEYGTNYRRFLMAAPSMTNIDSNIRYCMSHSSINEVLEYQVNFYEFAT